MKHSRARVCCDADGRINAQHVVLSEPSENEIIMRLNIVDTMYNMILHYAYC
jgi:hypothetical protein